MKHFSRFIAILAAIFTVALFGCQKSETALEQSYVTVQQDGSSQSLSKDAKVITVDSGYIRVDSVQVKAIVKGDNKNNTWVTQVSTPTLIDINTGNYQYPVQVPLLKTQLADLKLRLFLSPDDVNPAINVYGTFYDENGNAIAVRFIYNDTVHITVNVPDPVNVEDSVPAFVVTISPASWFAVPYDKLKNATQVDGTIYVTDTSNVEIYNAVIKQIGKHVRLRYCKKEDFENKFHQDEHMSGTNDNDHDHDHDNG